MEILKSTEIYRCETESEAEKFITNVKTEAISSDYLITKTATDYKTKKQKGEIIDEYYQVTIVKKYGE